MQLSSRNFTQRTNERHLFFGRNYDSTISFRDLLTFRAYSLLLKLVHFLSLGMTDAFMSNAHASVPEVTKPTTGSSSGAATSSTKLELVRSGGAASIEEELQQRASILAVDNANLRTMLDQTNSELHSLRAKMNEFDTMQQKLVKMQQQVLASDKESKGLKQTLKYLQTELVKTGKKMPLDPGPNGNSSSSLASQPLGGAAAGTTLCCGCKVINPKLYL